MKSREESNFINHFWDEEVLPTMMEYIKIPNKSPAYDKDWHIHGFIDKATHLIAEWCRQHATPNMKLEVIRLEDKTPIILIDIPSSSQNNNNQDTVLLYGHIDKQPEMTGWDADLHPWKPVLRGDRLYGRGSADDGYAVFAAVTAIQSLQQQKLPHARCVILIESSEESGSIDLPFYIDKLNARLGNPSLIICLDSGCGNYDQLWITTSLRGNAECNLKISVLKQGMHSGLASGVVPSPFRILRQLLNRVVDVNTGDILLKALHVTIPKERLHEAEQSAKVLNPEYLNTFPFIEGVLPESSSIIELILRNTWKPTLTVTGLNGFPPVESAGNVVVPDITCKLSLRLPPTCDTENAIVALQTTLEKEPPYNAKVEFTEANAWAGWDAPQTAPWLSEAINQASQTYYGREAVYIGEGVSIPFMSMLGKKYPQAQFMITGVLGPESNAHGPNEFLHIPMVKKLTACIASVIAKHYSRLN